METYVTLDEAARLEGIKYDSLAHKVIRNKDGKIITKTEKSESGGKDRVTYVSIQISLPKPHPSSISP